MDKAPDAFRTISEVAVDLELPQHVLRFWESRFAQIRPMKRAGGRRYYRPDDVDLLRGIRHLLYGEGYTIRGVQRILREQGPKFVQAVWQPGAAQPEPPSIEDQMPEHQVAEQLPRPLTDGVQEVEVNGLLATAVPAESNGHEALIENFHSAATPALGPDEVQRLQTALEEMIECRRMLDAVLRSDAA